MTIFFSLTLNQKNEKIFSKKGLAASVYLQPWQISNGHGVEWF